MSSEQTDTQDGPRRPVASGKFLALGSEKFYLRGVTYGSFQPNEVGEAFIPAVAKNDFAAMAASGINAVRTYTPPPRWLLDLAQDHGLSILVGLAWEQHVAFADDSSQRKSITDRVRKSVEPCAAHPAVLGYAIGNEIPAPIVRWHGRHRIERFLRRLYESVKSEDPEGLVTYVNFPSTEYLELPFLDFVCFNVYLEQSERLEAYLYRLHNLAGDRPLLLTEIGLDSRRNGDDAQAESLARQVRSAFLGGCAGVFTFAWTDEWWRGGAEIEDWDFGLTTRSRRPKPALASVRDAYAKAPFDGELSWPRVSIIVCTFNGSATLEDCLDGLEALDYPEYEVIVVDDGSTDDTATIAARYDVNLVCTPNHGLASARNTGLELARGEIVAYLDDDAWPDRHWLFYLVNELSRTGHCGVGGPNIAPHDDGLIAEAVSKAPGGPTHVLLTDSHAEHIPGCNMAFRRNVLREVGGFDPQFTAAGDDVDLCWRLEERGLTIGFAPAAVVWHHRRGSVAQYWRQQRGYGKAEALLERKWPERYNGAGQARWSGRMYGGAQLRPVLSRRRRVYHGSWGLGLFQSIYEHAPGSLAALSLMPESYLLIGVLIVLVGLGFAWGPLLLLAPVLAAFLLTAAVQAIAGAVRSTRAQGAARPARTKAALVAVTSVLHLVQPAARLSGRLRHGFSPWRLRAVKATRPPLPTDISAWSETWRPPETRLSALETALCTAGLAVRRGGDFDRWDLEARSGTLAAIRARVAIEEHGQGRQLVRMRCWPRGSRLGWAVGLIALGFSLAAGFGNAPDLVSYGFAALAIGLVLRAMFELSVATAAFLAAFVRCSEPESISLRTTSLDHSAYPQLDVEANA